MDESAKDRETKRLDQLRMTRERTAINGPYGSLGSATKDLKATQEELDAAFACALAEKGGTDVLGDEVRLWESSVWENPPLVRAKPPSQCKYAKIQRTSDKTGNKPHGHRGQSPSPTPSEPRYYDKLKPDCIQEGVSFAERAQRRQEEIDSLNEAYKILNGEMVDSESPAQKSDRGLDVPEPQSVRLAPV